MIAKQGERLTVVGRLYEVVEGVKTPVEDLTGFYFTLSIQDGTMQVIRRDATLEPGFFYFDFAPLETAALNKVCYTYEVGMRVNDGAPVIVRNKGGLQIVKSTLGVEMASEPASDAVVAEPGVADIPAGASQYIMEIGSQNDLVTRDEWDNIADVTSFYVSLVKGEPGGKGDKGDKGDPGTVVGLQQMFTPDTTLTANFTNYVVDAFYTSAKEYTFSVVKVDKAAKIIQIVSNGAYTNSETIDFDAALSDGIYVITARFPVGVTLYIKLNYFEADVLGALGNVFVRRIPESVYDNQLYQFFDLVQNFDPSILNVLKSLSVESSTGQYYGLRYLSSSNTTASTTIAVITMHTSPDLSAESKVGEFTIKGSDFTPYGDIEIADVATDNTYKGLRVVMGLKRSEGGSAINFRGSVLKISQSCISYVGSPYVYAGLGSSVSTYSWHNRAVNQANMMQYLYGVGGATFYTQVGSSYNTGTVAGTPSNVIMNQVARLFESGVTPDVVSLLSGLNDITIETGGNLENVIKNFGNTDIAFSITEALESIVASEGIDNAPKNWFAYIASLPDEDARYAYRCTASSLYAIIYFLKVKFPHATVLGVIPAQNIYDDAMLEVMYNVENAVYKALSVPLVDMYTELGWSKHTTSLDVYTTDGTHPNAEGLNVLQRYYERVLRLSFRVI